MSLTTNGSFGGSLADISGLSPQRPWWSHDYYPSEEVPLRKPCATPLEVEWDVDPHWTTQPPARVRRHPARAPPTTRCSPFVPLLVEQTGDSVTPAWCLCLDTKLSERVNTTENDDDFLHRIWMDRVVPVALATMIPCVQYRRVRPRTFVPPKVEPVCKIGGSGDCWRKLLGDLPHETTMTMQEFCQICDDLADDYGDFGVLTDVVLQADGDYHLEEVYMPWDCMDCFLDPGHCNDKFGAVVDATGRIQTRRATELHTLSQLAALCPGGLWHDANEQLIGASVTPSGCTSAGFASVEQSAIAVDATIEVAAWAATKPVVIALAKWYWERSQQLWSSSSLLPASAAIWDKLQLAGFDLTEQLRWLVSNLRHCLDLVGDLCREPFQWITQHFGLQQFIDPLLALPKLVARTVLDVLNASTTGMFNALDYGFLGLKIVNFLLQDFSEFHGPEFVYRRSLQMGLLDFRAPDMMVYENWAEHANTPIFATRLNRRLVKLNEESSMLATQGPAGVTTLAAEADIRQVIGDVRALPRLVLPESTAEDVLGQFQEALPEFRVELGVNTHPHPRVSAVRRAFRNRANDFLAPRNRQVRAVGASNTEMPTINRLVHNCWPQLSGRDALRQSSHHSPANAFHRAMSSDHKMQGCNATDSAGNPLLGADVWSFFSAHDIPPSEFISEMARVGSDTAVVALHLPFPLLDRRVTNYTDAALG